MVAEIEAPAEESAEVSRPSGRPKEVEISLPDGMVIVIGPPKASIDSAIGAMLAEQRFADATHYAEERAKCRVLCYVRSVNGEKFDSPPDSALARKLLEQRLGMDGVDAVGAIWLEEYRPIERSQIKAAKKY